MDVRKGLLLGLAWMVTACVPEPACCVACEDGVDGIEDEAGDDSTGDDSTGDDDDADTDTGDDEGGEVPTEALDRCDAGEPAWCQSWWQGMARGTVSLEHSFDGHVRARVAYAGVRTCVDGDLPFWAGEGVQDGFIDPALGDEGIVLEPGASIDLFPQGEWWCVEAEQPTDDWTDLDTWGERVPDRLAALVAPDADGDGDGVPDRDQFSFDGQTEAQHAVWRAIETEALLTLGKTTEDEAGQVRVRLTTRNLGRVAGDWTLEDTVPAGWAIVDADPAPDTRIGSVETGWTLSWEGRSRSLGAQVLTYTLARASGVDRVYVELPEARLVGPDQQTRSHPAAVYDLDVNQDGAVDCR